MEIEWKFRITSINRDLLGNGVKIIQGYLSLEPEIRVRIKGDRGNLTVKGRGTLARQEFEYEIPASDALELMRMTVGASIEKMRYARDGWEIDFYEANLAGLVTAEIELKSPHETVSLPSWMSGYDVTDDPRYRNRHLATINSLRDLSL